MWPTSSENAVVMGSLPPEYGSRLQRLADESSTEGKMWVEPNPYLLHRKHFTVVPKQVFLVQAWKLQEMMLPRIRAVLEPHGYAVKQSGDREGQLVFDDVWLMLNESEIVLVDFTDKRPNVYLEYGMALVLGNGDASSNCNCRRSEMAARL
jgi:hypothetical protein